MVARVRQHICTVEFHSTWKLGLHRFGAVPSREQVQGSRKTFFLFHTLIMDKSRVWRTELRLWSAQGRPKKTPPTVQKPNPLHDWNNSRLQSFFREVMEERDDTLILPCFSSSAGLACFRKFLYSSACRGVSLKQNKSSAVPACPQTNPILPPPSTQCVPFSSSARFFSYSTDSLEPPPRVMVEHWYLKPRAGREACRYSAGPRALLYTAAQSTPAGWQNHQLWVVNRCFRRKNNIVPMATISFLEGRSHHKRWRDFCSFLVLPVAPPFSQVQYKVFGTCSRPPAQFSLAGIWRGCLKFFGLNTCREGNEDQMLGWHQNSVLSVLFLTSSTQSPFDI